MQNPNYSNLEQLSEELLPQLVIAQGVYKDDGETRKAAVQATEIVLKEFQRLLGTEENQVFMLKEALEKFHDRPHSLTTVDCIVIYLALIGKMQTIYRG